MITVGVDEVGRGCWAGPLVAGAVILCKPIAGLRDSKKLSKNQREVLALQIHEQALAVGLGWVDAPTIDKVGISTAVKLAMEQAVSQIILPYDEIIIDGNIRYLEDPRVCTIIRADDSVPVVSAASIIAKVARDTYMATQVHTLYPKYGFDTHVGYGTKLHRDMLRQYGVTSLHRQSYRPIRLLMEQDL
jgi:ribonuclease HII